MLSPEGWLPQAKSLRAGGRARVPHDCGDGACMIVSHELTCYRAWCFRCCEAGYSPKVADRSEMVQAWQQRRQDDAVRGDTALPLPALPDPEEWPPEARLWLYKAGLSKPMIRQLGAYYHPPSRRVVLPVVQGGEVVYWQARAVFPGHQPKYINPKIDRAAIVPTYGEGSMVVLTEDILSAYRVGEVTEARALMGVEMKDRLLASLLEESRPVVIWLDPDDAGRAGARNIAKALGTLGVPSVRVDSRRDPKLLSKQEIHRCLSSLSF